MDKYFDTGFEKDCWREKREQQQFLEQFGDNMDFEIKERIGDDKRSY